MQRTYPSTHSYCRQRKKGGSSVISREITAHAAPLSTVTFFKVPRGNFWYNRRWAAVNECENEAETLFESLPTYFTQPSRPPPPPPQLKSKVTVHIDRPPALHSPSVLFQSPIDFCLTDRVRKATLSTIYISRTSRTRSSKEWMKGALFFQSTGELKKWCWCWQRWCPLLRYVSYCAGFLCGKERFMYLGPHQDMVFGLMISQH